MEFLISSPSMLFLCSAALFMVGILIGWLLRANVREKELNAEISGLRIDLQNSRSQYEATKEEFNLHAADARKAILEAEDLRVQVAAMEREKELDAAAYEAAVARADQLQADQETLQQSITVLEERVLGLRTQNDALTLGNRLLKEEKNAFSSLDQGIDRVHTDSTLLEETLVQLEKERDQAISDADEMASQLASLRQELAKSDAQIAILKVQLSRHENQAIVQTEEARQEANELAAIPSAALSEGVLLTPAPLVTTEIITETAVTTEKLDIQEKGTTLLDDDEGDFDAADLLLSTFGGIQPQNTSTTPKKWTDDLQVINGISEEYEEKLNALGVFTFQQVADLAADESLLSAVIKNLDISKKKLQEEDWAAQAKHLLEMGQG